MSSFEWFRPVVDRVVSRVRELGAEVLEYDVGAPSTEAELLKLEKRIDQPLPRELRTLFLTFAAKFSLCWQLEVPKRSASDPAGGESYWGEFSYTLKETRVVSALDYWWAESIAEGKSEGEWLKKVHLHTAPDGDFLAVGVEGRIANKPVYVPHDGTRTRYLVLGNSLEEFLKNWAATGFLMINTFWNFRDPAVEQVPWSAFDQKREFLGI